MPDVIDITSEQFDVVFAVGRAEDADGLEFVGFRTWQSISMMNEPLSPSNSASNLGLVMRL